MKMDKAQLEAAGASSELIADIEHTIGEATGPEAWHLLREKLLKPEHPIALHRLLFEAAHSAWDEAQGPACVWRPEESTLKNTNITAILKAQGLADYDALYEWSIHSGKAFWAAVLGRMGIPFKGGYTPDENNVVNTSDPEMPKWFAGQTLNVAESCFLADKDATAIFYQKEGSTDIEKVSFGALDSLSNRVANAIVDAGFGVGDRMAIDMPMNVEAVAIFLGILKMGGTVVSLADSFKEQDLQVRMEACAPVKLIFTQDVTGGARAFPLYPTVVNTPNAPKAIVVVDEHSGVPITREGDASFASFIEGVSETFEAVALDPEALLNIIFSSSTSSPKGKDGDKPQPPKAIPWKANTALKSAVDGHLHHNMQEGKVLCWPTNLGWMMGSFAIFAAFANKAALALYDGNVVSPEFCKFVEKTKVNMLGIVPSIAEGWEQRGSIEGIDWSAIECFSSTGSPSNPKNYFFLMSRVAGYAPVIEYMGGTEIGGGYLTCSLHQPMAPACFTTPTLGTELFLPKEESENWMVGEVFIVMRNGEGECPAMGLSTELLNFDHHEKYFERGLKDAEGNLLREHGDVIQQYDNGLYASGGRSDDGININGIKTSSLDIENYIKDARIEGVSEVAAVGVRPPGGGEDWLVIFAVASQSGEALLQPVREAIKARNPQLARVKDVVVLDELPLTASGKLRRRYLQDSYLEQVDAA